MAFATFQGLYSSDPYEIAKDKRVILSHPSVSDALILTEVEKYDPVWENWLSVIERTPTANLVLSSTVGSSANKLTTQAVFTVNGLQLSLFTELKRYQDSTIQGITIQDYFREVIYVPSLMSAPNWLSGSPRIDERGKSVGFASFVTWINLQGDYAPHINNDWYQLTFQVSQV